MIHPTRSAETATGPVALPVPAPTGGGVAFAALLAAEPGQRHDDPAEPDEGEISQAGIPEDETGTELGDAADGDLGDPLANAVTFHTDSPDTGGSEPPAAIAFGTIPGLSYKSTFPFLSAPTGTSPSKASGQSSVGFVVPAPAATPPISEVAGEGGPVFPVTTASATPAGALPGIALPSALPFHSVALQTGMDPKPVNLPIEGQPAPVRGPVVSLPSTGPMATESVAPSQTVGAPVVAPAIPVARREIPARDDAPTSGFDGRMDTRASSAAQTGSIAAQIPPQTGPVTLPGETQRSWVPDEGARGLDSAPRQDRIAPQTVTISGPPAFAAPATDPVSATVPFAPTPVLSDGAPSSHSLALMVEGEAPIPTQATERPTLPSIGPAPLARESLQHLATAIRQTGPGATEIALNPEELGRVRLLITTSETGIAIHLTADRAETGELLRRHAADLGQEMAGLGYENASFTFGERGDDERGGRGLVAGRDAPQDDAPPPTPTSTSAGLDLRL